MAINYQKVGWDTTKYFNPTNMNQMDNGINAACDKADANEAAIADVNNKLGNTDISAIGDGTLTGGLDALNSKLGNTDISAIGDGTVTGGLDALNSNLTTKVEKSELNGILYLFKEWRGWSDGTHVLVEQPNQSYCLIHIQNDNASELLSFSRIGSPELHHMAGDVIATNYITNGYTIQFDIPIYTQVMMYTIKTNL